MASRKGARASAAETKKYLDAVASGEGLPDGFVYDGVNVYKDIGVDAARKAAGTDRLLAAAQETSTAPQPKADNK